MRGPSPGIVRQKNKKQINEKTPLYAVSFYQTFTFYISLTPNNNHRL